MEEAEIFNILVLLVDLRIARILAPIIVNMVTW